MLEANLKHVKSQRLIQRYGNIIKHLWRKQVARKREINQWKVWIIKVKGYWTCPCFWSNSNMQYYWGQDRGWRRNWARGVHWCWNHRKCSKRIKRKLQQWRFWRWWHCHHFLIKTSNGIFKGLRERMLDLINPLTISVSIKF